MTLYPRYYVFYRDLDGEVHCELTTWSREPALDQARLLFELNARVVKSWVWDSHQLTAGLYLWESGIRPIQTVKE